MILQHLQLVVLLFSWETCSSFYAPTLGRKKYGRTFVVGDGLRAASDSQGAAVLLEQVSVYRGNSKILSDIDWRIEPRTKWGLLGVNGSGKSTLLQAISDRIDYEGTIHIGAKQQIGYLQQTAVGASNLTVYEESISGMTELNRIKRDMQLAQERSDLDALAKLQARFEGLGGYQVEQKIANVLNGLGFTNYSTPCQELSGGWQMRVAFARQLLSEHSIALLDEPR